MPEKKSYLPILYPNLGRQHKTDRLFLDKYYDVLKEPVVEIVEDPKDCDYLLIPYDFFNIEKFPEYINSFIELSAKHNKKILVFDFSDFDKEIKVGPNSIIFRVSLYRSEMRANEIAMPPFIEDLPALPLRTKAAEPTIGFNGYAKFSLRNLLPLGAHKPGLYFRRKAMTILENQKGIKTNFISRAGYAGHKDTIGMDVDTARQQFLTNLLESDLVLSPKGDGNYSLRFYEVLASGRIPILIDTDMILPLEGELDYSKFILRVDYKDMYKLPEIVRNFWENLSDEEFREMQLVARKAFEEKLRMDKFLQANLGRARKGWG